MEREVMARPRIGIALGSGAAKGWAHIGVLRSLQQSGVRPDVVCGCSMGALVGAAYACGRLDALHDAATQLTSAGILKLLDVGLSGGGLITGRHIVEWMRSLGLVGSTRQLDLTFAAVATDLEAGREVWLRDGAIEDVVRASISIPGIFSPVSHDGRWLADGALVNPVPVSLCRALGADIIIAVHVSSNTVTSFDGRRKPKKEAPHILRRLSDQAPPDLRHSTAVLADKLAPPRAFSPGYFDVLLNALNIMEDQITRSRLAGEPPHLLLAPQLSALEPMEFHRAKEAINEGFECMEQSLPALRRLMQTGSSMADRGN
jgi:NTE family protein